MTFMQSLSSVCCRRRVIVSRLLPVLLQIILIVVVWKLVKSHMEAKTDVKDLSKRSLQSMASNEQPRCLFAEFSQAQLLRSFNLSSIISSSNTPQHQGEDNKTPHLVADVYVRDRQKGTVVFYPAGTLADIGDNNNGKKDDKYVDVRIDNGNNFPNYDSRAEKDAQGVNDKTADYVSQHEFQYGLGNLQNQQHNSVSGQSHGNANSVLNQNQMQRSEFGGQQAQESGHNGLGNAGRFQYQNGFEEANQHPMQPPYQNVGPLVNTNNLKPQVIASERLMVPNQFQQLPPENTFQRNEGQEFDAQGHQIMNTNHVQVGGNQLNYQNMQRSSEIEQSRGADSQIQQNAEIQSNVQQWGSAGSGFQLQNPILAVPSNGNTEPLLLEGYLDRAKKFIIELYGKLANSSVSVRGSQSILLHMNNPQACQGLGNIDLLYLVNSKPQSSDMRQNIRNTFVKTSYFQPSVVVHVFLVGKTTSPNFQQSLNQEQQQYGDIVQGDFIDNPENATSKGLMGMQWLTQFCPQAKFIMIINEDVFVDTDKLIHAFIPATRKVSSKRFMLCLFTPQSPIPRSGPNAVSDRLFSGRTNMRPYCKGFAILTTRGVISSLLAASEHAPQIYLDELYLYGILPFIAGGIDVFDVGNKRAFSNFGMETVVCYQQQRDKCPFVASVAFSERFTSLWEITTDRMHRMQQTHQGWPEESTQWNIQSYIRKF